MSIAKNLKIQIFLNFKNLSELTFKFCRQTEVPENDFVALFSFTDRRKENVI
jgi:hypothetical protein